MGEKTNIKFEEKNNKIKATVKVDGKVTKQETIELPAKNAETFDVKLEDTYEVEHEGKTYLVPEADIQEVSYKEMTKKNLISVIENITEQEKLSREELRETTKKLVKSDIALQKEKERNEKLCKALDDAIAFLENLKPDNPKIPRWIKWALPARIKEIWELVITQLQTVITALKEAKEEVLDNINNDAV